LNDIELSSKNCFQHWKLSFKNIYSLAANQHIRMISEGRVTMKLE